MTYCYQCKECKHTFEKVLLSEERNQPISQPCPACQKVGEIQRDYYPPVISHLPTVSIRQQAGSGFNDVLKKIKSGAGRGNKIQTL